MKESLTLLLLIFGLGLSAQPLSGSYTDCNNRTEDIQATLASGKSLIIAHKGVDCSICVSQAPALQNWAAQNSTRVAVWAALTYKYDIRNFTPACTVTQNWISTHSWNNIFTFPDNARQFVNIGTPRYYVYSARDSTIKYSGGSQSQAYSIALQESIVGLNDEVLKEKVNWQLFGTELLINNQSAENIEVKIFNLKGRPIIEKRIQPGISAVNLVDMSSAVYLIQFSTSQRTYSEKIAFNQ